MHHKVTIYKWVCPLTMPASIQQHFRAGQKLTFDET